MIHFITCDAHGRRERMLTWDALAFLVPSVQQQYPVPLRVFVFVFSCRV